MPTPLTTVYICLLLTALKKSWKKNSFEFIIFLHFKFVVYKRYKNSKDIAIKIEERCKMLKDSFMSHTDKYRLVTLWPLKDCSK